MGPGPGISTDSVLLHPDHGRHPSAWRFTAVGKKALGSGERTVLRAAERRNAGAGEALGGERVQIGLPAAPRVARKRAVDRESVRRERCADLAADLEPCGADRGAEPRDDVLR